MSSGTSTFPFFLAFPAGLEHLWVFSTSLPGIEGGSSLFMILVGIDVPLLFWSSAELRSLGDDLSGVDS